MEIVSITLTILLTSLLVWSGTMTLISRFGGWSRLASVYRVSEDPGGRRYRWQNAKVGGADYGNCVTIGVSDAGLYLALPLLLRFAHPCLLIPWHDLNVLPPPTGWIKRLGTKGAVGMEVGQPPLTKIYVPKKVLQDLEEDRATAVLQALPVER